MEWSIETLLRGENYSKQSDEIQATAKYHLGVLRDIEIQCILRVNQVCIDCKANSAICGH